MTTFQSRKNYTFLLFSNFSSEFDSQVEAKIGDTRSYNHYVIGNRKLNRASKSNHVGDKSWYYVESIISPPPWKILTSSRLPISRFSSRDRNDSRMSLLQSIRIALRNTIPDKTA